MYHKTIITPQHHHHRQPIRQSRLLKAFTVKARAGMPVEFMKNKNSSTLYQVLRISKTACTAEIKAAYRNLAKVYHPDPSPSPETSSSHEFMEIHKAYATLVSLTARARYDISHGANRQLRCSLSTTGRSFRPTKKWETDQCW